MHVTGKRDDGYHNLETIFFPLPFFDVLEIITAENLTENELHSSGIKVDGNEQSNLCLKAYHLLKNDFPHLPFVKIYLHKNIPVGGGLGGGSADGAFMLRLLSEKFDLHLHEAQLSNYALHLGSDCPFFIINKPCFAQQRGEKLEEIEPDIKGYKIVLLNPGIHIDTRQAFSQIVPQASQKKLVESIQQPIETWEENITNDFEAVVFKAHPSIQKTKTLLYESGAVYAAMSGSGSTVFGIFKPASIINFKTFIGYSFTKEILL